MDYKVDWITHRDRDDLILWDEFVNTSPQGTLFSKAAWLDSVRPDGYKILLLTKSDKIVAGMPLCSYRDENGRLVHNMPGFTQVTGILLRPLSGKLHTVMTAETRMVQAVVDAIPEHRWFYMQFHYSFTNWMPFYWNGYDQSTRYTYTFVNIENPTDIFECFDRGKRKNIDKAKDVVKIETGLSAQAFRSLQVKTYQRDGKMLTTDEDTFFRIYQHGKEWHAIDVNGNIHSAIFVVYDELAAYYLCSCVDRDHRKSGANTLLIWKAIEELSKHTHRFDFEGSMIPGVENSFRHFGATRMPYFVITKGKKYG